jgi:hypothetical protein
MQDKWDFLLAVQITRRCDIVLVDEHILLLDIYLKSPHHASAGLLLEHIRGSLGVLFICEVAGPLKHV